MVCEYNHVPQTTSTDLHTINFNADKVKLYEELRKHNYGEAFERGFWSRASVAAT